MNRDGPHIIILVEAGGGVMRHIIDLYHGLKQQRFNVTVILSPIRIEERYKSELSALDQGDLIYLPMRRWPHPSDAIAYWTIRKIIKRIKGRKVILHAHSTKAGLLGFLLKRSLLGSIYTPHAYRGLDPELTGLSRFAIEMIESMYSRSFDRVIAEVPLEYEYGKHLGLSKAALQMIPNAMSLHEVDFDEIYARRMTLATPPTLGFVGRLVHQKNPLLFIEVLNEVIQGGCDAKAVLLGEGPFQSEMKKLAGRYGIADRIEWRGETPAKLSYPDMDVLVHTSLYEGTSYTLLEASAALLPIVATSNPGSRVILGELLPDNLVAEPNARIIAGKVIEILQDNALRLRQVLLLKQIAEKHSTEAMLLRYKELYDSVLAKVA